jgi:ornithine--oxo-acid transaminase
MSTDDDSRRGFGPFLERVGPVCPASGGKIPFNDVGALERALNAHGKQVAAFLVEPIQGEAGYVVLHLDLTTEQQTESPFPFFFRIIVPADDYLEKCQALCKKHNVLLICDEVQTVRIVLPQHRLLNVLSMSF